MRKRAEKERLEQAYAQLTAMTPEKARSLAVPPLCTARGALTPSPPQAAAMREQDKLRRQMQIAFKSGDAKTAQRIQRRLDPETK